MTDCKGAGPESAATDPGAQKNVGSGKSRSSKPQPSDPQAAPKFWCAAVAPAEPAHFQQAKTDGPTSQFLQIVAKPKRSARTDPSRS